MNRMTLRFLWVFLFGAIILLFRTPSAYADSNAQSFLDAVKQYETGEYTEASEAFETLAEGGIRNGKLYYNIANSYLKQGRLGPAILWYERAARLIPGDPDVRFNLDYARTLLKDEPAALGSPVLQVLFFWKDLLRVSVWQWLGITTGVLFWCFWAVAFYYKKSGLKLFVYGFLGMAMLASGTAVYRSHASAFHPRAVILDTAVSIRSGFSTDTTELFVLHEGTVVAVEKQTDGFLKIRYADDKIGWVSTEMAEII